MPTSKTDLDDLIANGLDWPDRDQIHRGDHGPQYYEGLADILDDLPENPTPDEVIATMDDIAAAILNDDPDLRPARPGLSDNPGEA